MMADNAYPYNIYRDRGENGDLLQRLEALYEENITLNLTRWSEADTDMRFNIGDQTLWNDIYGNIPSYQRYSFMFNRIKPIGNMITGYQRKNRKALLAVPVEDGDQKTADILTDIFYYVDANSQLQETVSSAFESGAFVTGMSLISMWLDYSNDPINGDFRFDHIPYSSFIIDPYWTKQDLSDCSFIWRRKWVDKNEARMIFPGQTELVDSMQPSGNRDGKFQFQAQAYNYSMNQLLPLDEVWYREDRVGTFLVDNQSGETMEYRGKKEDIEDFLLQNPNVSLDERRVGTVKLGMVLNGSVMYDGENPLGIDNFPFVPVIGHYTPEVPYMQWRCQGMVRPLRDAQYLYNRRMVIQLDIMESQVNSGAMYKPGSLVNPKDVFQAGQGKPIAIKDNKEMTDFQRIPAPAIPESMLAITKSLGDEVLTLSGLNEESMGMANDEIAGVLGMLRQGAGMTSLQKIFDQLDTSYKLLGDRIFETVQRNWTPQKVGRITQETPTEEFFNGQYRRYHVRVEEGLNTTTQRQQQFAQLLQLKQLGVPVPDDVLLQESTLQNKDALVEAVRAQQEQAQQQQQLAQELEMKKYQAEIEDLQGRAQANAGLGAERVSRIPENRALALERVAEGERDRQAADLDRAKTITELEGTSVENVLKALRILDFIKENPVQENSNFNNVEESPLEVTEEVSVGS